MSATPRTTFIADSSGAIVPWKPKLTRDERLVAYRQGLIRTTNSMGRLGFATIHQCEHSCSMQCRGLIVDFRIQRPENVAHITSRETPTGEHKSAVYKLSTEITSEFALMITISAKPAIFVDLSEALTDPASTIERSVLGLIASLTERDLALARQITQWESDGYAFEKSEVPKWLK